MKLTKKNVIGAHGALSGGYISNLKDVYKSKEASIETLEMMGYTLVEKLFVDSSGFGQEGEMALTASQFEKELDALLDIHGTLYSYIVSVGMFQVYVGLFKKTGASKCKRVGHATLRIETETGYKIRYHSTDVIEFDGNDIVLNSGGWETVTTKKRMNEYLPRGLGVQQKNFEWTVHDYNTGKAVPFVDGMRIINSTIL